MRILRPHLAALLLLCPAVVSPALADLADAFTSPEEAVQVNERTVGVVFERDERFFDLIEDIEASLRLAAGLRIVPIVGRNHVQNVYDLLYLDGVDLALVRSDSIEYVRRVAGVAGTRRLTRSLASVGEEKIVVVAHAAHGSLDELAGLPVAFGRPGSGEFVTGTLLFESIGVEVEKVEAEGEDALAKVRSGELAAMVHLLGAPGTLEAAAGLPSKGEPHVLALPTDERLATLYRPATLDARDLPGLVPEGRTVPSYAVDVNLVAYSWSSPNDRTRRMERFVDALVDRLQELQGHAFQPEWRDVSLEPRTPNIDGSPMVEQSLAAREAALERWHERRSLARERDREARVEYVEQPGAGRTKTIGRRLERDDATRESDVDRLLDGLDALLAIPTGRPSPVGAAREAGTTPETLGPTPTEPGPVGYDG